MNIIFATDMKIRATNGLLEQTVNQNINVPCALFQMTSMKRDVSQSRAQSFSSSLSAVGRRDKLWDNGIFVPEIVGHRL